MAPPIQHANQSHWIDPPPTLTIDPGAIHLWRCTEDIDPAKLADLAKSLSPEENRRAAQYRFEPDRNRFVLCRAVLRDLLGRYLGCSAQSVLFAHGLNGKPQLDATYHNGSPLDFNLSHTKGMCLIGFALGHPIGVDVEAIDPKRDWAMLGRRFLHPNEWQMISRLPLDHRAAAFYTCWTCKEAYLKASGEGLTRGLTTFEVVLKEDAQPVQLVDPAARPVDTSWWMQKLDGIDPAQPPHIAAAVASPERPDQVQTFQYRPQAGHPPSEQ
jgi:4'-phosphopantetheinyl transferase